VASGDQPVALSVFGFQSAPSVYLAVQ